MEAYVGRTHKDKGYAILEYNPYEEAIILHDEQNQLEIWLEPDCLDEFIDELTVFNEKLKVIKNNA